MREEFQLCVCTLTALFADSRDYELLVPALPAFANCSEERLFRERLRWRRWDGVKIVHFGDEQPQRGASSAL